ncbi:MAG: transglycosylase domain-containing protein [Deltaproteobacteria bacterium]|nr:transglycosylase domain-containing protein [Deltaproteobacteria bacterium]
MLRQTHGPHGRQAKLRLADVPDSALQLILQTEDSRFFYHPGVDVFSLAPALFQTAFWLCCLWCVHNHHASGALESKPPTRFIS